MRAETKLKAFFISYIMAKIKIKGCGKCSKSKGCKIKKSFRDIALTMPHTYEYKSDSGFSNNWSHTEYYEINFKCPHADRKFKEGDEVEFTFGIGRYEKLTEWDCDWDSEYSGDPCSNCRNEDRCNDGVVTFKRNAYREYIKIKGTIENLYNNSSWVIKVSDTELKHVKFINNFNKKDSDFIALISEKINNCPTIFRDNLFISKERFIKKV